MLIYSKIGKYFFKYCNEQCAKTNFKIKVRITVFCNSEVRKLTVLRVSNIIAFLGKFSFLDISNYIYFRTGFGPYDFSLTHNGNRRPPSPLNLTLFKDLKNVALTRNFSDSILHNPIAIELYNSLYDMYIGDESFYNTFATLDFMPNGSFVQNFSKELSHGMGSKNKIKSMLIGMAFKLYKTVFKIENSKGKALELKSPTSNMGTKIGFQLNAIRRAYRRGLKQCLKMCWLFEDAGLKKRWHKIQKTSRTQTN